MKTPFTADPQERCIARCSIAAVLVVADVIHRGLDVGQPDAAPDAARLNAAMKLADLMLDRAEAEAAKVP